MPIQTVQLKATSGYIMTLDGGSVIHVPNSLDNMDYRSIQDWIAEGNIPWPADPLFTLAELRTAKSADFMAEGVTRIAAQVPDWNELSTIKTVAGLWVSHLATNATAAQITAKDIYLYVRNTVPSKIAAVTTQAELDIIDPTTADPFGDGTPWPT